jgi:hypothetical protein
MNGNFGPSKDSGTELPGTFTKYPPNGKLIRTDKPNEYEKGYIDGFKDATEAAKMGKPNS